MLGGGRRTSCDWRLRVGANQDSRYANAWSGATLDRVQVTGSRSEGGRYLQPRVEYSESVSVVFELKR